MRNLSTIYPGRVTIDANNPDGTFKNEVTPGVSGDGTPLEEKWQQDIWGAIAHLLNKVSVSPDGVQENEATSQIYDALETASRTLWTSTATAKGSMFLPKRIQLSNGTDAAHDIDTTAGNFIFSGGDGSANIGAFTKQIDATWAAGTAAGGMAAALAVGNNTWYHYHALSNADGTVVDFGFDTSVTATNLLADAAVIAAGLTKYSLQESVLTDGSANILPFYHIGDEMRFVTRITDVTTITPGTSAVTPTMSTPLGREVLGIFRWAIQDNANGYVLATALEETDSVPGATINTLFYDSNQTVHNTEFVLKTNTLSQIRYRFSSSPVLDHDMWTLGWRKFDV